MELINAIAKVRFASASPQRIHVQKTDALQIDLLCLEPGQEIRLETDQWAYYVVKGKAGVSGGGTEGDLTAGQVAVSRTGEKHTIVNAGEQRLICIAVGRTD